MNQCQRKGSRESNRQALLLGFRRIGSRLSNPAEPRPESRFSFDAVSDNAFCLSPFREVCRPVLKAFLPGF